jgi:DNA-binding NarL/FixJ family response regulator
MTEEPAPARVVVVDDDELVRDSILDMLSDVPDLQVVGEAMDGRDAVELSRQVQPDLILMDVRMPRLDGLAATRAIKRENPRTSGLIVTIHENPEYLMEALKAGAAGYILKDATREQIISALRGVLSGESPLDPELAAGILRRFAGEGILRRLNGEVHEPAEITNPPTDHPELLQPLTPRELEVLELLAVGRTNQEIARAFGVSRGTVKRHVENLIAKLGVSDRTQAAVRALDLGIISFPEP